MTGNLTIPVGNIAIKQSVNPALLVAKGTNRVLQSVLDFSDFHRRPSILKIISPPARRLNVSDLTGQKEEVPGIQDLQECEKNP
jgi:hypothetical protein